MHIVIFGAGAYGTALEKILTENHHTVNFYDPLKFPGQNMSAVTRSADVSVLAVPSAAAQKLLLFIPIDIPLICATKGFLSLAPFKDFKNFSILSGGAFAADLVAQKPTTLTGTSPLVQQLFTTDWLTIEQTNDQLGVLLCGALKNIYAIGAGYYDLRPGQPEFEQYIQSTIRELRTVLTTNGCDPATALLSCGLHDLVITCAYSTSRNHRFGATLRDPATLQAIQSGQRPAETTEGLSTIRALATSGLQLTADTPILHSLVQLVTPPAPAKKGKR